MKENAHKVATYFVIYKNYLQDNDLDDDSDSITVKELIEFVDNLDEEDRNSNIHLLISL